MALRWTLFAVPVVPIALISACGTVLDVSEPSIVAADAAALEDAQRLPDGSVPDGSVATVDAAMVDATIDTVDSVDAMSDASAIVDAQVNPQLDAQADAQVAEDAGPAPSCTGGSCLANPPSGWRGPFVLYTGLTTDAQPACSGALDTEMLRANATLVTPSPASACSCTCGPVSGAACGQVSLLGATTNAACSQLCPALGTVPDQYCLPYGILKDCLNLVSNANFAQLQTAGIPSGGSCGPTAGKSFPPYSWGTFALGCRPSNPAALTCPTGTTCLPTSPAPFRAGACVVHDGNVTCPPSTPYTVLQERLYQSAIDGRECTTCSCGAPTGVACDATATPYTNGLQCTGTAGTSAGVGECVTIGQGGLRINATASGGQCAASPVTPTGTVMPTMDVTVCCTQ